MYNNFLFLKSLLIESTPLLKLYFENQFFFVYMYLKKTFIKDTPSVCVEVKTLLYCNSFEIM